MKDAYSAFCPITAVYEFVPIACNQYGFRWHEAGPLLDDTKAFAITESGSCVAVDPSPSWETYQVEMKSEIPLTAFAQVARTEVGDGAIQQTFLGEMDQPPLRPTGVLTNRERGEVCAFYETSDGALRCVPTASAPDVAYSDPSCTVLVARGTEETDCAGVTKQLPLATRVWQLDEDHVATVFDVGAASTLATIYRKQGAACLSEPGGTVEWHALTVVDPTTLPLGTEKIDP